MGSGGVGVWEVNILAFDESRSKIANAILSSQWREDADLIDHEEWYSQMISILENSATSCQDAYLPAGDGSVSITDEIACTLFDISDDFGCECDLNTDGSFTYVQIIDAKTVADNFTRFLKSLDDVASLPRIEREYLQNQWGQQLINILEFLSSQEPSDGVLFVQLVTSN